MVPASLGMKMEVEYFIVKMLATVSVPSRPVFKPQLIPKVKITSNPKQKVKVKVQKIGLLKAHTPIVLVLLCHLPAPQARSEDLLLAQP